MRLAMSLDDNSIGPYSNARARQWNHFLNTTGSMAWINYDGKVTESFNSRYDGQVESEARMISECANPPFAQNDLTIISVQEILGGKQKLIQSSGHPAFQ